MQVYSACGSRPSSKRTHVFLSWPYADWPSTLAMTGMHASMLMLWWTPSLDRVSSRLVVALFVIIISSMIIMAIIFIINMITTSIVMISLRASSGWRSRRASPPCGTRGSRRRRRHIRLARIRPGRKKAACVCRQAGLLDCALYCSKVQYIISCYVIIYNVYNSTSNNNNNKYNNDYIIMC